MQFKATVDKKYILWQRINLEFEAENSEEAMKKLSEGNGLPKDNKFNYIESNVLYNTEIPVEPEECKPVWELIALEKQPESEPENVSQS